MRIILCSALVAIALSGCIARHPLTEPELSRWWTVQQVGWQDAQPQTLSLGQRTLPSRWVIRQEPSLILSTVSLVRAIDRLKEGPEEIDFSLSPAHMNIAADAFASARRAIENLREMADLGSAPTAERWAEVTARLLANVEGVVRLAGEDAAERGKGSDKELLGWSTKPLVEMAIAYIDQRTGGNLLETLDVEQAGHLREVITQLVLRLGFAMAGKQEPPALRAALVKAMAEAKGIPELESSLREILLAHFEDAAPAPPAGEIKSILNAVLSFTPPMLEVMEMFFRQWDKMEYVAVEFRRLNGEPTVAVLLKVAPKRQVRIDGLFFMQPAIVLRGGSRIIVLSKVRETGETTVVFEPLEAGACEVRFEGFGYALVRLLALPLSNAALREIRVVKASQNHSERMINVVLLMEATGDTRDPRRLIAFSDVKYRHLVREAFSVHSETTMRKQVFTYIKGRSRYTYRRIKTFSPTEP